MNSASELCIVFPVFNEGAYASKVVVDWFEEVHKKTKDFTMLCLDDGSSDDTSDILKGLKTEMGDRLEYLHHENRGHGQTCLEGYREACRRKIPYVLQIDSDGQCLPQHFPEFWDQRERFDVVCGFREQRQDGFDRKIISTILSMSLRIHGCHHPDANVPYRLMKTEKLEVLLSKIPANFHLANVALSLLLEKSGKSHHFIPIDFPVRNKPKAPIGARGLVFRAIQLHQQLLVLGDNR